MVLQESISAASVTRLRWSMRTALSSSSQRSLEKTQRDTNRSESYREIRRIVRLGDGGDGVLLAQLVRVPARTEH